MGEKDSRNEKPFGTGLQRIRILVGLDSPPWCFSSRVSQPE